MADNDWKARLGMVYSTNPDFQYDTGTAQGPVTLPPAQQDLRVWLDRKQRGGKVVTLVRGFVGSDADLHELARLLKTRCGVGGAAKDGEIIIQGDHRDRVVEILAKGGYRCKKPAPEMRRLLYTALFLCALGVAPKARAQYYTWGSDPAGLKWSTIRTPDVRMIYPDTVSGVARRTLFYIRTVQPDISYGFRHGPMRIPFVMHPENFQSNGLVMYLPKRVEFLTSPAIDGYSMPWYKQLVAHEYRHAVQYNNLNRGVIRALSYILGQQGSTIGLLCMPIWAMEGDAVMSETAMSSFGRGLQPSFSMGYRAMGRVGRDYKGRRDRRNIDKWFCGSYRDYIPDHYELGYQICSYAYARYDENVWDRVAWFGSRNPYMLATTRIALEKYYGTNVRKLFARPSTRWNVIGIRCPEPGTAPRRSWRCPKETTRPTSGRCRSATRRCWCSRPITTVRRVSYGSTPVPVPRSRCVIRGWSRPALRCTAGAYGGRSTAVRSSSSSGSTPSFATWIWSGGGTYLRRAAQCALSDAGTRGTGLGRV